MVRKTHWLACHLLAVVAFLLESVVAQDPDFTISATPETAQVCIPADAVFNVDIGSLLGFSDPVTLSSSGQPAGTTANFSANPVTPPGSSDLTISNTGSAASGDYLISILGVAPTSTHTSTVSLSLFTAAPGQATLASPANGATNVPLLPSLIWSDVSEAASYLLELDTDPDFTPPVLTDIVNVPGSSLPGPLEQNMTYYWRVQPGNACGLAAFSAPFSFTTGADGGVVPTTPDFDILATPERLEICAPNDAVYTVGVGSLLGFSDPVTLSSSGQPAGTTASFSSNPVIPPASSEMAILNTGGAAPGDYVISILGVAPTSTHTSTVELALLNNPPGPVTLNSPADGASNIPLQPSFEWSNAAQASLYELQLALDVGFASMVVTDTTPVPTTSITVTLQPGTTYFWRVQPGNACGLQVFSAPFSFTTQVEGNGEIAPVPTLSTAGIVVLSLILAASGLFLIRRGGEVG